jgi:hypothetical protein
VPAALEISRSGNGAHAWIFFTGSVSARDARRLGTAIISHTCARTRQLKLEPYDRLFPNQDSMPKGGFGNLIALPLQKAPRERGCSVFVDGDLRPYRDQWAFLATIQPMPAHDIEPTILRATGNTHPLDVTFIDEEDQKKPWKRSAAPRKLAGPMPQSLTLTIANLIYFEKAQLPQPLANRLIRLAAFQNPEFYKKQAMRFSVWDEPRVIGCTENYPNHIALPRGCLDSVLELLRDNKIRCDLIDERYAGESIVVAFAGTLRLDQEAAVAAMLHHDTGVLCAPTAFGKTVTAAAMIASRGMPQIMPAEVVDPRPFPRLVPSAGIGRVRRLAPKRKDPFRMLALLPDEHGVSLVIQRNGNRAPVLRPFPPASLHALNATCLAASA